MQDDRSQNLLSPVASNDLIAYVNGLQNITPGQKAWLIGQLKQSRRARRWNQGRDHADKSLMPLQGCGIALFCWNNGLGITSQLCGVSKATSAAIAAPGGIVLASLASVLTVGCCVDQFCCDGAGIERLSKHGLDKLRLLQSIFGPSAAGATSVQLIAQWASAPISPLSAMIIFGLLATIRTVELATPEEVSCCPLVTHYPRRGLAFLDCLTVRHDNIFGHAVHPLAGELEAVGYPGVPEYDIPLRLSILFFSCVIKFGLPPADILAEIEKINNGDNVEAQKQQIDELVRNYQLPDTPDAFHKAYVDFSGRHNVYYSPPTFETEMKR